MADKAYFLSDLHLGSSTEPKSFLLLRFLKSLNGPADATHIFLLGDIFDLWVSRHEYFINKFATIISELKRLNDLGTAIIYFEGNHDLYLQDYFGNELGFEICTEADFFDIAHKRLRIEHGDQMDLNDRGYLFLRWFWRTPFMKWLAPRIPGWLIVKMGEAMSRASRHYTDNMKSISSDGARLVIHQHALRAYKEQPFDMIISGHVHVREDRVVGPMRVINLGSWFEKEPHVLFLSDDVCEFRKLE